MTLNLYDRAYRNYMEKMVDLGLVNVKGKGEDGRNIG